MAQPPLLLCFVLVLFFLPTKVATISWCKERIVTTNENGSKEAKCGRNCFEVSPCYNVTYSKHLFDVVMQQSYFDTGKCNGF